jgi:hypothetical protein
VEHLGFQFFLPFQVVELPVGALRLSGLGDRCVAREQVMHVWCLCPIHSGHGPCTVPLFNSEFSLPLLHEMSRHASRALPPIIGRNSVGSLGRVVDALPSSEHCL